MKQLGRVAVLLGGKSGEREVSLKSGSAVLKALLHQGINAEAFDPSQQPLYAISEYDIAFIALHGRYGEDGTIQGALELMGIPYTGSGVLASAIGMDKWRTKMLWRASGIPTPPFALMTADSAAADFQRIETDLGLPLFVKPANEGSSIGISKVTRHGEIVSAFELAAQSDPMVLAERYIDGGEYTVGILGQRALPIIRIVPATEFYDYEAKYLRDDTQYLCPCGLSPEQESAIQADALRAFHAIGGQGWGRVDFLLDKNGQHYFLEVNTSPGMTDHSLVPMAAKAAGLDFETLVMTVLELAMERQHHVG